MSRNPHRYLPVGDSDLSEMLSAIEVSSVDELFSSVPAAVRFDGAADIAGPLSDQELRSHLLSLSQRNQVAGRDLVSFLGGGAYRHETPSVVDHFIQRGEFLTVYTPYQPEVSQGTLQAIFEFQTFISMLSGLPVANASMYEGASSFAEAVFMAQRVKKKRSKVVISRAIHPEYRATLAAYAQNLDFEIVEIGWDESGRTDLAALEAAVDEGTACVAVQSPNYFGVIEGWTQAAELAHAQGALMIGVVTEALSMALLKSPGASGCDIACGEAQSFGLPVSFGGPYLGFMSARDTFKRSMPGRLAGETVDAEGKRSWVLTLSTREQHIRREKSTSNICTNQALCALAATIYLSLHGRVGLRRLAEINAQRSGHLRRLLASSDGGFAPRFDAPTFNETLYRSPVPVDVLMTGLAEEGVLAGVPIGEHYPELEDCFLTAVTECNEPAELETLEERLTHHAAAASEGERA